MLIAEDLLLLLMNRPSGKLPRRKDIHTALAAATLIETDEVQDPHDVEDRIKATVPGLYRRLLDQLTEQGVLTKSTRWWSATVWRPTDPAHRNKVINDLTTVLFGRSKPDQRTGALITLVTALGVLDDLLEGHSEEATRRAEEISAGDWPADEVTKAIISESAGLP